MAFKPPNIADRQALNRPKRFYGRDPMGIPRVTAQHTNIDVAEEWCREEARLYAAERPDTWPLSEWTFHRGRPYNEGN